MVQRYRLELGFELVAYCLMENHVHLLLRDTKDHLDLVMKKIAGSYAYYFNHKYDIRGHLFQDRYGSEVVEDDAYLMTAIRYIHRNPEKAGIALAGEYRWSSYDAYLRLRADVDNAWALELIGGAERIVQFMERASEGNCLNTVSGSPFAMRAQGNGSVRITRLRVGANCSNIIRRNVARR